MKIYKSIVPKHEGLCASTWLNTNILFIRTDNGTTGLFKNTKKIFLGLITIKTGEEFHGILRSSGIVEGI